MNIYWIFALVVVAGTRDRWFPVVSEFAHGLFGWGGGDSWSTQPVTKHHVASRTKALGWRNLERAA